MLLLAALGLGCNTDKECAAGFEPGEDGNCYPIADSGDADTDTDTDADSDADSDADTDADTDTDTSDPPGFNIRMGGTFTITGGTPTGDTTCHVLIFQFDQVDPKTHFPLEGEPPSYTFDPPCPTTEGEPATFSKQAVSLPEETTTIVIYGQADLDGDDTTHDDFGMNPMGADGFAVEDNGNYLDLAIQVGIVGAPK